MLAKLLIRWRPGRAGYLEVITVLKLSTVLAGLIASFALAQDMAEIDGATTGWLMVSTAFVFLMVIGLPFSTAAWCGARAFLTP